MAKNLNELLKERPVNRKNVNAHKKRMLEEVRSYRLRELRKASDLSQVELAERLHVSQNRVSRIEHGDIERAHRAIVPPSGHSSTAASASATKP